jgi:hypothetical protein
MRVTRFAGTRGGKATALLEKLMALGLTAELRLAR